MSMSNKPPARATSTICTALFLAAALGAPANGQEQPSCDDQREALSIQVQILLNARAQLEANLASLAVQMAKLQRQQNALQAEQKKKDNR